MIADLVTEDVGRALLLTVKDAIEDAIDEVWDEYTAKDAAYFGALSVPVPVTPKLYPVSYFLGHIPTVLEREVADYPTVSVICFDSRSAGDGGSDQWEVITMPSHIELFAVNDDEETVNRMAQRYARALQRVIVAHKGLDGSGIVQLIDRTPTISLSNTAARRVDGFSDAITFIQGCRLETVYTADGEW